MKNLVLVTISVALLSPALGAHLLAMHFSTTGSYIRIMEGVLSNLAQDHKITLYSIVHEDFPHPNVTVVKLNAPSPKNFFTGGLFEILCDKGGFYISKNAMMSNTAEFVEGIFADPNIRQLLVSKTKFDALITFATFSEHTLQFADLFKIPIIQISPPVLFSYLNDAVGNPHFLSTQNQFYTHIDPEESLFWNRVKNYWRHLEAHFYFRWIFLPRIEAVTKKYFPPDIKTIASIHRNTSLVLSNTNNAMGYARPNMPNVIEIGGIHCRPAKPLPADLEEFISGSGEHGIIYFSFGSSIRSKFPDYVKNSIIRVLGRLKQRVLWKWNEDITDLPSNVKVSKWFSQQDVLGHNKTRLFITQSGIFSMTEAAYHGVPILAIPIAFDQPANAVLANDLGYCEYINFCNFSEERLYELIQMLLTNPKYKRNASKISKLMNDQPETQGKRLKWWVNFVLRHKGNPLTDNMKIKSYGLERLDVDVVIFLYTCAIVILFSILYILYKMYLYISVLRKSSFVKEKTS